MNGSMVSRYPSGSNRAAAAVRAISTPIACSAIRRSGARLIAVSSAALANVTCTRIVAERTAPMRLSQNGKKPGPGPKASVSE